MTTSLSGTQSAPDADSDPYSPEMQQQFANEWNSGHFTELPLSEQVMVLTYWKALASNDQVGNLRNRAIYITSVYTGDKAALMAAMPRIAQVDICNQWAAEWVQLNEYQTPMSEPPEFPDDLPAFPIVWVPDPRLDKASYTSELQSRYYNAWHSGNFPDWEVEDQVGTLSCWEGITSDLTNRSIYVMTVYPADKRFWLLSELPAEVRLDIQNRRGRGQGMWGAN
jgi:hypothetical protein